MSVNVKLAPEKPGYPSAVVRTVADKFRVGRDGSLALIRDEGDAQDQAPWGLTETTFAVYAAGTWISAVLE